MHNRSAIWTFQISSSERPLETAKCEGSGEVKQNSSVNLALCYVKYLIISGLKHFQMLEPSSWRKAPWVSTHQLPVIPSTLKSPFPSLPHIITLFPERSLFIWNRTALQEKYTRTETQPFADSYPHPGLRNSSCDSDLIVYRQDNITFPPNWPRGVNVCVWVVVSPLINWRDMSRVDPTPAETEKKTAGGGGEGCR